MGHERDFETGRTPEEQNAYDRGYNVPEHMDEDFSSDFKHYCREATAELEAEWEAGWFARVEDYIKSQY